MTNQTSIQYISSLLDNPASVNDGDQSSISLFRQTFPYFVPVRYLVGLESHRKTPFSPQMLSAIWPYIGDWMMFCDFMKEGSVEAVQAAAETGKAGQDAGIVLPQEFRNAPKAAPVFDEPAAERKQPEAPVAQPIEEQLSAIAPIVAVVSEEPQPVKAPEQAPVKESQPVEQAMPDVIKAGATTEQKPQAEAQPDKEDTLTVPEPVMADNASTGGLAENKPVTEIEAPANIAGRTAGGPENVEADTPVAPPAQAFIAPAPVIVAEEPLVPLAPQKVNIPASEEHTADTIEEKAPAIPIPVAVKIPEEEVLEAHRPLTENERIFMDLVIDHEEVHAEDTGAYAEPVSGVSAEGPSLNEAAEGLYEEQAGEAYYSEPEPAAPAAQAYGESVAGPSVPADEALREAMEIVNEQETEKWEHDPLIFPIYTKDYFLQQGEKISDEIPLEINELRENGAINYKDKSLMVVMSFSEWLLHFKNSSEKQREETKDQKALKTMWQKEKLAAAIEEENEEIPETVFALAVNSITKEDGLISETLAEIYMKQGKYDKAIDMYRKLSLKNPQKSAYFAAKIDEALKDKES